MAMLKTISQGHYTPARDAFKPVRSGHTGSCKTLDDYLYLGPKEDRSGVDIERYLESGRDHSQKHRPLAFGSCNLTNAVEHGWSREMDKTRRRWGKNHGRTYYHFVISADPEDHVGAVELKDVALEWVQQALPGAQAIVSVHADNANGLMHAHIVVNSVYPDSGYKIHRTNSDVEHEADLCQDICRAHGLGALPYLRDLKKQKAAGIRQFISNQPVRRSVAEVEMERSGRRSWMAEIRHAVDDCAPQSRSWGEFERMMASRGFAINRPRRGGITFVHPDSTGFDKRAQGHKMGTNYSLEGIEARFGLDLDGALSGGSYIEADEKMAFDRGHNAKAGYRKSMIRRAGMRPVVVPGRKPTMGDVARGKLIVHRSGKVSLTAARANMQAVGVAKQYRCTSLADIRSNLALFAGRIEALEARAQALTSAASAASEALAAANDAAAARHELEDLPKGIWSITTRQRRNELLERITNDEAKTEQILSTASQYISEKNLEDAPDAYKARAVAQTLRAQARDAEQEARGITSGLRELQAAADTLGAEKHVERGYATTKPFTVPYGTQIPQPSRQSKATQYDDYAERALRQAQEQAWTQVQGRSVTSSTQAQTRTSTPTR